MTLKLKAVIVIINKSEVLINVWTTDSAYLSRNNSVPFHIALSVKYWL